MHLGFVGLALLGMSSIISSAQAASSDAQTTTDNQPVDVIEAFHKGEVSLEACLQADRLFDYASSIKAEPENLQTLRDLDKYVYSCQLLIEQQRQAQTQSK